MKRFYSLLVVLFFSMHSFGIIRDIKVLSDNTPDWTDLESAVKSMTNNLGSDEQKAIALWKWTAMFRHQVPTATDSFSLANGDPSFILNPIKIANNYGNTFCVSTNSFPALFWKHLGKEAQEYDINAHTVCDLKWNNAWHNFDAAFGFYYKDAKDNHILGLSEIMDRRLNMTDMMSDVTAVNLFDPLNKNNASIYQSTKTYNIMIGSAEYSILNATRTQLYSETYSDDYNYRWNMKPYESYTRLWTQIEDNIIYYLPADQQNTTNPNKSGPGTDGLNIQTNGIWTFKPDLTNPSFLDALSNHTGIEQGGTSALHPANTSDTASIVYRVDGANIISHANVSGNYTLNSSSDIFEIYFSADSANWIKIFTGTGTGSLAFSKDFGTQNSAPTNLARTREHYFLKFSMKSSSAKNDCGLSDLVVTTYTIVNQRTLPKLTLGSNRIKFVQGSGTISPLEITYYWTEFSRNNAAIVKTNRSFKKTVTDSSTEFVINTAGFRNPVMDSLRVNWPQSGPSVSEGYNDGIDVGTGYEAPRYYYTFGRNIAEGTTVTTNPVNANAGRLLDRDGGPGAAVATWAKDLKPEITFDFGKDTTVAGIRFLQGIAGGISEYLDSAVIFTSSDGINFTRQGSVYYRQVWEPITNYIYPNIWDANATLVANRCANILYNKFSYAFDNGPVPARYIKAAFFNSRSSLNLHEFEIYSAMTKTRVVNELDHGFTLPDPSINAQDIGTISIENKKSQGPAQGLWLFSASPNPFTSNVTLTLNIDKQVTPAEIIVQVYNIDGRMIKCLTASEKHGTQLKYLLNGTKMAPGVYVAKASVGRETLSARILLLR